MSSGPYGSISIFGYIQMSITFKLNYFRKILTTEKGENLIRIWQLGDEEYGKLSGLKNLKI